MSTKGLTRSDGSRALGKYVETKKPLPTQWKVLLRWTPSTLRDFASLAPMVRSLVVVVVVEIMGCKVTAGPATGTDAHVMLPITSCDGAARWPPHDVGRGRRVARWPIWRPDP